MGFVEIKKGSSDPIPTKVSDGDCVAQNRKLATEALYRIIRPFKVPGITSREQRGLLPRISRKELARATGLNVESLLAAVNDHIFSDPDGQNWCLNGFSNPRCLRRSGRPKRAERIAGAKFSKRRAARTSGSQLRTFAALKESYGRDARILDINTTDEQPSPRVTTTNGLTRSETRQKYLEAVK